LAKKGVAQDFTESWATRILGKKGVPSSLLLRPSRRVLARLVLNFVGIKRASSKTSPRCRKMSLFNITEIITSLVLIEKVVEILITIARIIGNRTKGDLSRNGHRRSLISRSRSRLRALLLWRMVR